MTPWSVEKPPPTSCVHRATCARRARSERGRGRRAAARRDRGGQRHWTGRPRRRGEGEARARRRAAAAMLAAAHAGARRRRRGGRSGRGSPRATARDWRCAAGARARAERAAERAGKKKRRARLEKVAAHGAAAQPQRLHQILHRLVAVQHAVHHALQLLLGEGQVRVAGAILLGQPLPRLRVAPRRAAAAGGRLLAAHRCGF